MRTIYWTGEARAAVGLPFFSGGLLSEFGGIVRQTRASGWRTDTQACGEVTA